MQLDQQLGVFFGGYFYFLLLLWHQALTYQLGQNAKCLLPTSTSVCTSNFIEPNLQPCWSNSWISHIRLPHELYWRDSTPALQFYYCLEPEGENALEFLRRQSAW